MNLTNVLIVFYAVGLLCHLVWSWRRFHSDPEVRAVGVAIPTFVIVTMSFVWLPLWVGAFAIAAVRNVSGKNAE